MGILVVEDEALIRLIVVEELTDRGFEVYQAETGEVAAGLITAKGRTLSMLITDVHMPGRLDGFGVASLVREHYPEAPIIFTTGRPDIAQSLIKSRANVAVLSKPFLPSQLIALVRQLLQPESPSLGQPDTGGLQEQCCQ